MTGGALAVDCARLAVPWLASASDRDVSSGVSQSEPQKIGEKLSHSQILHDYVLVAFELGIGRQGSAIQPADFLAGASQVGLVALWLALSGDAAFGFRRERQAQAYHSWKKVLADSASG